MNNSDAVSVQFEDKVSIGKRKKHLSGLISYFWKLWRKDYLTMLREKQKMAKNKEDSCISINDVVIVYDKRQPRHLWKLARVIDLIKRYIT